MLAFHLLLSIVDVFSFFKCISLQYFICFILNNIQFDVLLFCLVCLKSALHYYCIATVDTSARISKWCIMLLLFTYIFHFIISFKLFSLFLSTVLYVFWFFNGL